MNPNSPISLKKSLTLAAALSICIGIVAFLLVFPKTNRYSQVNNNNPLRQFANAEEFKEYLSKASQSQASANSFSAESLSFGAAPSMKANVTADQAVPNRVSTTNVQVAGIDEPDIVKTDGKNIFFSSQSQPIGIYYDKMLSISPEIAVDRIYPPSFIPETKVITATPLEAVAKLPSIPTSGELLLSNNTLVSLSYDKIQAFDVSDAKLAKPLWNFSLDQSYLENARTINNDKLLLITKKGIDRGNPCPMPLYQNKITVPCDRVYYPANPISVDSTYTVSLVDIKSGNINQSTSFVGGTGMTTVYVSSNSAYLAYTSEGDTLGFYLNYLKEKASDLIPTRIVSRIAEISSYNISSQSKLNELLLTLSQYKASLSSDEALKVENELNNRLGDYSQAHIRELESTQIAKFSLSDLRLESQGQVPGHVINQFALDEFEGNLRIATTSQGGYFVRSESVNDVYVLDNSLKRIGEITNLAQGEQIYSARFIQGRGYLVTYKQIDPFFVLDLRNPRNPQKAGELKIPGYSSYLHPLADNLILGVGQEGGSVKLSLFDVTNPQNPSEISKYIMDEYWSEVSSNHHAFLQDPKHNIFFIPGGKGGYIFSYEADQLSLKKSIANYQAKRALYINDYLYIISEGKLNVLWEQNWEMVKEVSL